MIGVEKLNIVSSFPVKASLWGFLFCAGAVALPEQNVLVMLAWSHEKKL